MRAAGPIATCCLESFNGLAEPRAPDSEDSPNISETGDPLPRSRLPSEKFAIQDTLAHSGRLELQRDGSYPS